MSKIFKIKIFVMSICAAAMLGLFVVFLSACANQVNEPKSFAFDSWTTVSKVAEGGLDKLKDVYKPLGDTFIIKNLDDNNEVLAKTRSVFIEGVGNFKVRVIGENHDIYENGKKAPLTFEFVEYIQAVPYTIEGNYSNNWETSELRNFLNNKFVNYLPKDLADSIKQVKKDTCKGGCEEIVNSTEKIFPLSATEINAEKYFNVKEGCLYQFYIDYPCKPKDKDDLRYRDKKNY